MPKKKGAEPIAALSAETKAVGEALRAHRGKMSGADFGKIAGITQKQVSKFECGLVNINNSKARWTLFLFAWHFKDAFGLSWLEPYIGDTEEMDLLTYFRLLKSRPDRQRTLIQIAQDFVRGIPGSKPPPKPPPLADDERKEGTG